MCGGGGGGGCRLASIMLGNNCRKEAFEHYVGIIATDAGCVRCAHVQMSCSQVQHQDGGVSQMDLARARVCARCRYFSDHEL